MRSWRTISISPLPPDWVTVWGCNDSTFWTQACPALLLQEEIDGNEDPPETRVVPVCSDGSLLTDPDYQGMELYMTTTRDNWEKNKAEAEEDVSRACARDQRVDAQEDCRRRGCWGSVG